MKQKFEELNLKEEFYKFYNINTCFKSDSPDLLSNLNIFFKYFHSEINLKPHKTFYILSKGLFFEENEKMIEVGDPKKLLICAEREIMNSILSSLDFLTLHSASIVFNDQGILFPGVSGMGKSSLTFEFVKGGYKYLSDDITPIDLETLKIMPFPKATSIRKENLEIFDWLYQFIDVNDYYLESNRKTWFINLDDIFPDSLGKPCNVSYIFFPFPTISNGPKIKKIVKTEALIELMKSSLKIGDKFEEAFFTITELVDNADCYRLGVADIEKTVKLVQDII